MTPSTSGGAGWPPCWIGLAEPCIDPDFDRFQKALGIETRVARGPHVILLHQHSDAEADERIALLERVITGYHLLFAAQGVELRVPRRRLVSAWFADQKDYLAFLRSEDAEAFATTRGYFHPTWKAVVAYDARSSDPPANGSQQVGREARRVAPIPRDGRPGTRPEPDQDQARGRAGRGPSAVPRQTHSLRGSTVKSRARRCSWIWIGGRSTWGRRPTR